MSKVSRSDNVYHLHHTRCARVAQRADLRSTASSFVISVFECGDHTVEAGIDLNGRPVARGH